MVTTLERQKIAPKYRSQVQVSIVTLPRIEQETHRFSIMKLIKNWNINGMNGFNERNYCNKMVNYIAI